MILFDRELDRLSDLFRHKATKVDAERWQGRELTDRDDWTPWELLNVQYSSKITGMRRIDFGQSIRPNLPWAEDHFRERISGEPLNPGKEWANWPGAKSAETFQGNKKFSHTYMERYWPKSAGDIKGIHQGIRYRYGDLNDVIQQLIDEPTTRQAYLPIFFPEDTGAVHKERVPCSIGYHFMIRDGYLHCWYFLRSCDFVRHYKDDMYLTCRLMEHVAQSVSPKLKLGYLHVTIASLHIFRGDLWQFGRGDEA